MRQTHALQLLTIPREPLLLISNKHILNFTSHCSHLSISILLEGKVLSLISATLGLAIVIILSKYVKHVFSTGMYQAADVTYVNF